jgi:hypothetical protein
MSKVNRKLWTSHVLSFYKHRSAAAEDIMGIECKSAIVSTFIVDLTGILQCAKIHEQIGHPPPNSFEHAHVPRKKGRVKIVLLSFLLSPHQIQLLHKH